MKISYEWLKNYVDVKQNPAQLAEDLSRFGFNTEGLVGEGENSVLDLEINPNRGDCLSVLGIAREVAALYNLKVKMQNAKTMPEGKIEEGAIDKNIEVTISEPNICPRYSARVISNIEIKPSPAWLQKRLSSFGFRPINNIVDITNYVMVATGQPMHAFDLDKIKNGEMKIGLTQEKEELITLDGKHHKLPKDTIVIRDSEKIYDLAGIMGGYSSGVDEKTQIIVLQAAIFNPILIRRVSKKLAHVTDASYRYERGVDYEGTILSIDLGASLIKESVPAAKIGKLIDKKEMDRKETEISLNENKVNELIGINSSREMMVEYLKRLGFTENGDKFVVPSYRVYDVKIWQDLAEEIARIYGYENIDVKYFDKKDDIKINDEWTKREAIKNILFELGFTEIYSTSFIDEKHINLLGFNIEKTKQIENPLSPETQYLRPSVISSLLLSVSRNPWAPEIAIYEIGKVFYEDQEYWQVGIATVGKSSNKIQEALKSLNVVTDIKNIEQTILDYYKIRRSVNIVTFELEQVKALDNKIKNIISTNRYHEISKYPPTVRDLAFIADANVKSDEIQNTIKEMSEKIIIVELFDEFTSEKFGQNKKNMAYHIWLEDLKGPMSEEEVNIIIKTIIETIEEKFGAKLRS